MSSWCEWSGANTSIKKLNLIVVPGANCTVGVDTKRYCTVYLSSKIIELDSSPTLAYYEGCDNLQIMVADYRGSLEIFSKGPTAFPFVASSVDPGSLA
jgi:hypothetical protein